MLDMAARPIQEFIGTVQMAFISGEQGDKGHICEETGE